MANRVTDAEVKSLVDTQRDTNLFIGVANRYVDLHLLPLGSSEAELRDIELYIAAHFTALTEERGGLTQEQMGDSEQRYAHIYEAGLRSTRFGQTAITLDSTGILADNAAAEAAGKLSAQFRVVGYEE